jgi:hypothetical protein
LSPDCAHHRGNRQLSPIVLLGGAILAVVEGFQHARVALVIIPSERSELLLFCETAEHRTTGGQSHSSAVTIGDLRGRKQTRPSVIGVASLALRIRGLNFAGLHHFAVEI